MSLGDCAVIILAGGRSRRLGRDKPFVEIGGRAVLERLLEATAGIDEAVIAVRETGSFERALERWGWTHVPAPDARPPAPIFAKETRRVRLVPDPDPDLGPAAGLASGLGAVGRPLAVVLSGDLPFVTAVVVRHLVAALRERPSLDAIVPVVDGHRQPLCAAYRRAVADRLDAYLRDPAARARSLMGWLDLLAVGEPPAMPGGTGELERAVRGIDTPEEVRRARARTEHLEGEEGSRPG